MTDQELLRALMDLHDGGLTQEQAAKLLGMTQPGILNVLSGRSRLSRVGRAFAQYLLRDAAPPRPTPATAEWAQTLRRLADEMETLPSAYTSDEYVMADVG